MPKRPWFSRLILLLIALLILPSFAGAKPATPAPATPTTPGTALIVARRFVDRVAAQGEIPEWADVTLGTPTLFETPDGAPSVYVIDVRDKGGTAAGFVAVSADEESPKVVEFSQAEAPHLRVAQAQSKSARNDAPRLLHGGPSIFLARFDAKTAGEPVTLNLMNMDVVRGQGRITQPPVETPAPPDEPPVRDDGDVSAMNLIFSKKVASYPVTYNQSSLNNSSSACGPATGATLLWYWSKVRGLSGLTSGYSTWTSLGNHMYLEMNTYYWGTYVSDFAAGIQYHGYAHGGRPNFRAPYYNGSSSDYYSSYKTEIDNNRPAAVYVGLYFGHDDTYEYHFMSGYGYYHDATEGFRGINVVTNWGYSDMIDYDYYRSRYSFYYIFIRP